MGVKKIAVDGRRCFRDNYCDVAKVKGAEIGWELYRLRTFCAKAEHSIKLTPASDSVSL